MQPKDLYGFINFHDFVGEEGGGQFHSGAQYMIKTAVKPLQAT